MNGTRDEGYFAYNSEETDYLSRRDPELGREILRIGQIQRAVLPDPFTAIVNSILSQQISSKALETVWQRITRLLPEPTPEAVLSCDSAALRACGISGRKEGCIRRLAGCAASGELDLDALGGLSDARVKEALTGLSGIGEWTAEMFLLFSLQRRDILAKSDFGIQKGLMRLHALPQITEEVYMRYRRLYSPCGSVASLYLWEIAKLK